MGSNGKTSSMRPGAARSPHASWHAMAAADQPHFRDGVVRRTTRACHDQGHAGAGEADDAVDARGLEGLWGGIAGRMVVRRRASIDLPAPGGPSRKRLWAERLHDLQLYQNLKGC
jgi:hypothetical protein